MNIFFVDRNPVLAAQSLYDCHVVKMILESAQLLSSVHHITDSPVKHLVYKLTHKNHPCSIWVRQSWSHYQWLFGHACGLLEEYKYRFNKSHASQQVIFTLSYFPNQNNYSWTDPPQAMPEKYKTDDTVEAYRQYYRLGKTTNRAGKRMDVYTKRTPPSWIKETVNV